MPEKATFAAGCFWGVEAEFRNVRGVLSTKVGYTGGTTDNPTYEDVCSHTTGHAEALEIEFDPALVSYEQLLDVLWTIHDPTQLNRQGPDVGSQYRSAVFVHSPKQETAVRASIGRAEDRYPRPIVTQVAPATTFWEAEDYHQRYLERRGLASCANPTLVDASEVESR